MTEHKKIDRKGAKPAKSGSLFERANSAFGLDALSPAIKPSDLPEVEKRAPKPAKRTVQRQVTEQKASEIAQQRTEADRTPEPATPAPKPSVALGGEVCVIDRGVLRSNGLIVPEDSVTGTLEEFRIVKRELLADARAGGEKARRIIVCSPHPGEGKTYCSVNLAIALAAEQDIEVLLVDADVLKPSVPERLGFSADRGLIDALENSDIAPEKLVVETDIDRLFVLPAGKKTARGAELLASARTGEVLDRLTQGTSHRIVVFDTPPALAASAAPELAAHVGQALLVARADETSKAALEDAHQLLSACDDIKLLLNGAQFSPSGRQFGGYGERED